MRPRKTWSVRPHSESSPQQSKHTEIAPHQEFTARKRLIRRPPQRCPLRLCSSSLPWPSSLGASRSWTRVSREWEHSVKRAIQQWGCQKIPCVSCQSPLHHRHLRRLRLQIPPEVRVRKCGQKDVFLDEMTFFFLGARFFGGAFSFASFAGFFAGAFFFLGFSSSEPASPSEPASTSSISLEKSSPSSSDSS